MKQATLFHCASRAIHVFMQNMFDEAKAQKTLRFIHNLKHTKGVWHGKNFDLLPWQEKIIRDLFGTMKENGYRQYNTAYVEIPKKNGKSELAAAVALYMTCGDGEWGAEVYGCSSTFVIIYG